MKHTRIFSILEAYIFHILSRESTTDKRRKAAKLYIHDRASLRCKPQAAKENIARRLFRFCSHRSCTPKASGGYLLVEVVLAIGLFATFSLGAIGLMGVILPFANHMVLERQAQGVVEYVKWALEQKVLPCTQDAEAVIYAYASPKGIILKTQKSPTELGLKNRFKVTLFRNDTFLNINLCRRYTGITGKIENARSNAPLCWFHKVLLKQKVADSGNER